MAYLKDYDTMADVMQGSLDGKLVHVVHEFTHLMTIGEDLPWVPATHSDHDEGVFEDNYEYNHSSQTADLDSSVKTSKTGHYKRKDPIGMREGAHKTNHKTYQQQGSRGKVWRSQQVDRMIRDTGLDFQHDIFYGNPSDDPNQFLGLFPRFSVVTDMYGKIKGGAKDGEDHPYITLSAGGTAAKSGKLCSVFIICPEPVEGAALIYPNPDMVSDITHGVHSESEDFRWRDAADGGEIKQAFDYVQVKGGLRFANRRAGIRICDIDVSDVDCIKRAINLFFYAMESIPINLQKHMLVYCPPQFRADLKVFYNNKITPSTYADAKPTNVIGDFVFDGIFWFRGADEMLMTESRLAIS